MAEPLPPAGSPPLFAAPAASANPYAAPRAAVDHGQDGDSAELAGRGQRLRAAVVDYLIFAVPVAVGVLPMALSPKRFATMAIGGAVLAVLAFIAIVAWNGILLARNGQTIGKKSAGIRVVRTSGDDAGFARLFFLRSGLSWLLASIPGVGGLYALLDVLFIFRADRRCLHDLIADTKVVEAD